jgi:hypothetical protein
MATTPSSPCTPCGSAFEGIELLTTRRLTLPVAEPNLTTLRAVRTGDVPLGEALALIEDAERRLRTLVDACALTADATAIDAFLVRAHVCYWQTRCGATPVVSRA